MTSTCLGLNVLRDVGTDISFTTQVCKLIVLCLKCKTLVCQPFDIALYVFSPVGLTSCHEIYTRCCVKNSLIVVFECFHKLLSFCTFLRHQGSQNATLHHWERKIGAVDEPLVPCMMVHFRVLVLTHWGRVTLICVSKLTIIGSDNGLSPGRRQAIIWTNAGI